MNNKIKRVILNEIGFLVISLLLVVLFYFIAGTFLTIWIKDFRTLLYMGLAFYIIIGFYRWLNSLARKYQNRENNT
jgi:hypothetical protein